MPRSSLHSTARLLQELCPSLSQGGTVLSAPIPDHGTNDRGNVNNYLPFITLPTQMYVNTNWSARDYMQIYKTQQDLGITLNRRGILLLLHRWAGLTASPVAEHLQSAMLWVHLCAVRSKGFSRDLVTVGFIWVSLCKAASQNTTIQ